MGKHCYFIATSWGDKSQPKQVRALANELAKRGHQVVLLISGTGKEIDAHEANPAVWTWPSRRPTRFRDLLFLYRLIKKYRPDCLAANFAAVNIMVLAGWLTGVGSRVCWYHTLSSQQDLDSSKLDRTSRILRYFGILRFRKRFVYRKATHFIPVSEAAREDIKKVYRVPDHKCKVFHNSLADPLDPVSRPSDSEVKETLLCVGRLDPSKGQDILIKAMATLRHSLGNIKIEFIGDGVSKAIYQKMAEDLDIEDKCMFRGALPHGEVLNRMRTSIATIVPSITDNCPLVVLESLAVGTPVIASESGGIVELVRDGVDGYLVPPGDPNALAEKIEILCKNSQLRESMSIAARTHFLQSYEQESVLKHEADWFETILTPGRRPITDIASKARAST